MKRILAVVALAVGTLALPRVEAQRPMFSSGTPAELTVARERGLAHLRTTAERHGIAPDNVAVSRADVDRLSMAHTRVQQMVRGVPVFGGEAIAHFRPDGELFAETDNLVPGVDVDTTPRLTAAAAIDIAVADYGCKDCLTAAPSADLMILREGGADHLVYRVQMTRLDGTSETALPVWFVDAHGGYVVMAYNNLQTGTGSSLYSGTVTIGTSYSPVYMEHFMENLGLRVGTWDALNSTSGTVYYFDDFDDVWDAADQRAGVDAHYGAEKFLGYLQSVHARNGIDGVGGPLLLPAIDGSTDLLTAVVHWGLSYNNAFWSSGGYMVYGDGDGTTFSPLVTLDIAGHEMTHGVTQYTAGLIYNGESGALNESWSDVFGAMLERHVRGESANTWLMGEDAYTPGTPGDSFRYMDDPHRAPNHGWTTDDDPDHYSERCIATCPNTPMGDNGGVHINSGIANKAFYLLAKGGTHHLGGSMTGIGADDAARIWFLALTSYMTSSTNFLGARTATLTAAGALFGTGSTQHLATAAAWCLVGVGVCAEVAAISVTPNTGTGLTQAFTLQYSDSLGATADLASARVRFAVGNVAAASCTLKYNAITGAVGLQDNAGTAWLTGVLGSGSLANSQCTVNLATSTATPSGNNLTLVWQIAFSGTFTGLKDIRMMARSAGSQTSGWQVRGTWTVPPPVLDAISVAPNAGTGVSQAFTLEYSDSAGATDIASARVRFAVGNVAAGSCTLKYNAMTGAVGLLDDAGVAWLPGTLGMGTLANGQCSVNLVTSTATANGNTLTLVWQITFTVSFAGAKDIRMMTRSAGGTTTGWVVSGTWTVPLLLEAVSVTPNNGAGGPAALFVLTYVDQLGATADLSSARVRFAAGNVAAGSCTVRYNAMTGAVGVLNDAGTAWLPGTFGTMGMLGNSQCTVNLAFSSAVAIGVNLTLELEITFSGTFTGQKDIRMMARSAGGATTGWLLKGTWTPTP